VLVNNAGICIPGSIEDLDLEQWNRTIDVDLTSVFLGCRAALPLMRDHAPGSIVNISSISGLIAGHNLAAYNAAKAGVWLVTKSIALHAARKGYDIRANSVHPTFIDTDMVDAVVGTGDRAAMREKLARQVPLGRIGTTDDVAFAVLYLASDESRFMTGAELKLDGGISAM
jgi:NAD(P)-dependent dehydrogenase (short-subunit alcohol dehydrogenase family)